MLDFDWRRLFRWCLLLTIVMALWSLAPTIKCSYSSFRETPISDVDSDNAADADKDRVQQGTGFWTKWGTAIKGCYRKKPLLGQEPWKRDVLIGLAALMVVAWALDRYEKRRKRTYEG